MVARSGKPSVVLLAEDDPGDQELTRRALQDDIASPQLYIVSDGEEAMDFLLHRGHYAETMSAPHPDLMLLDLNMPKLDGRQVLQQVRRHPELHRLPVIVLTTSRQEEDILRSYDLGCNSFITKPLDLAAFMQTIKALGAYWFDLVSLPSQ